MRIFKLSLHLPVWHSQSTAFLNPGNPLNTEEGTDVEYDEYNENDYEGEGTEKGNKD